MSASDEEKKGFDHAFISAGLSYAGAKYAFEKFADIPVGTLMDDVNGLYTAIFLKMNKIEGFSSNPDYQQREGGIGGICVYWVWLNEMIQKLTLERDRWKASLGTDFIAKAEEIVKKTASDLEKKSKEVR